MGFFVVCSHSILLEVSVMRITFYAYIHPSGQAVVGDYSVVDGVSPSREIPKDDSMRTYGPLVFLPSSSLGTKIMSLTFLAEDNQLLSPTRFDHDWANLVYGVCLECFVIGLATHPKTAVFPTEALARMILATWVEASRRISIYPGEKDTQCRKLVESICRECFELGVADEVTIMIPVKKS